MEFKEGQRQWQIKIAWGPGCKIHKNSLALPGTWRPSIDWQLAVSSPSSTGLSSSFEIISNTDMVSVN